MPLLADTKQPHTLGSRMCLTADGMNYLLEPHPNLLDILVLEVKYLCGQCYPVHTGTGCVLCIREEMKADHKHKGADLSTRSDLTALSCAISTGMSAMVMLVVTLARIRPQREALRAHER